MDGVHVKVLPTVLETTPLGVAVAVDGSPSTPAAQLIRWVLASSDSRPTRRRSTRLPKLRRGFWQIYD